MDVNGQLYDPTTLPPKKHLPMYRLDRRQNGPQVWSGCGGEEKNSLLLSGIETRCSSSWWSDTTWLNYAGPPWELCWQWVCIYCNKYL